MEETVEVEAVVEAVVAKAVEEAVAVEAMETVVEGAEEASVWSPQPRSRRNQLCDRPCNTLQ